MLVEVRPNAIVKVKFKDRILSIDTVQSIAGFVFLYMFILTLTTVLITLGGHDFTTALTAAASSIRNIGPGFNAVGPTMNYGFFQAPIKLLLSFVMIARQTRRFLHC